MRTRFIGGVAVVTALVLAAGCSSGQAPAGTDPEDLQGKAITLIVHPTLYAAMGEDAGMVTDFEAETGVTVDVVKAGLPDLYDKLNVEFAAQSDTYDVLVWDDAVAEPGFWDNLLDLAPALEGETGDLIPALLDANSDGDSIYGMPFRSSAYMVYYRQDLLKEAGFTEFPTTSEDFLAAAAKMKTDKVAGLTQMATNPEIAVDFTSYLYSFGGTLLSDDETTCTLQTEQAVQAADAFLRVFAEFAPKEAQTYSRDDYMAAFSQERTAMSMFVSSYYGRLVDPDAGSVTPDQVGGALMPSSNGVEPGTARLSLWAMGVNRNSSEPAAATAFVKYLTSEEAQLRQAMEYSNGPVRASTFEDEGYVEEFPYAPIARESLEKAVKDPAIPETNAIRNELSTALQNAVAKGSTGAEAMADACSRIDRELSR